MEVTVSSKTAALRVHPTSSNLKSTHLRKRNRSLHKSENRKSFDFFDKMLMRTCRSKCMKWKGY